MDLAIITGVSKGLGASVAKLFLKFGTPVIGVSRTDNIELANYADENSTRYDHYQTDLKELDQLEELKTKLTTYINTHKPETIFLINNAAMVNPVHQVSKLDARELIEHINLNLTAPMILTNALLGLASDSHTKLIGLTVTSGAADSPIYGWSAYCSSKAGINMYTRTTALEQEELSTGHKVVAFNPGIMDTEMQADIRSSSHDEFIDVDRFKEYKEQSMLRSSEEVAQVLYKIITLKDQLTNGYIYSVSD